MKYVYINLYLSNIPMWNICNSLQKMSKLIVLKVPLNFNEEYFLGKLIYDKDKIHKYILENLLKQIEHTFL